MCVCVVRKAKRLINGFHLGQENSLLTPALSSLLRRESACIYMYVYVCAYVCVCMEREREEKGGRIKNQIANLELHPDSSKNEGS